jgi:ComF family protein
VHNDVLLQAWAHPHLSHLKCDHLFALDKYRYPLTYLIPLIKFHQRPDLATYLAQQFYQQRFVQIKIRPEAILSVPLHRKRLRQRGYNQAALLADELQCLTGIVHIDDAISRVKLTRKQSELNQEARQHNIKGAFAVSATRLQRLQRVAIIDDVVTTGATINEVCQAIFAVAPHLYIDVWCIGVGEQ